MWPFDQNNQQMYQQYAQAHQAGDYSTLDQNQAMGNMQQFMQNAPADTQQQVYQQHFDLAIQDTRPGKHSMFFQREGVSYPIARSQGLVSLLTLASGSGKDTLKNGEPLPVGSADIRELPLRSVDRATCASSEAQALHGRTLFHVGWCRQT
jgi:hypothetical protein